MAEGSVWERLVACYDMAAVAAMIISSAHQARTGSLDGQSTFERDKGTESDTVTVTSLGSCT